MSTQLKIAVAISAFMFLLMIVSGFVMLLCIYAIIWGGDIFYLKVFLTAAITGFLSIFIGISTHQYIKNVR